MDYNNFSIRILSSVFFIILYLILFFSLNDKIIYFATFIYLIILIEILLFFKNYKKILIIYILFSYCLLIIYFYFNFNLYEFSSIILCISCFDSSCYLLGKTLGKKKIFFKISPNKTYEGLFGGVIITNLLSFIIYFNLEFFDTGTKFNLIILTNIVILFSFFGDLIQSYFKRLNNLKDSSSYIPGHGGFFDRFDSFLLVIIPFSIMSFLL